MRTKKINKLWNKIILILTVVGISLVVLGGLLGGQPGGLQGTTILGMPGNNLQFVPISNMGSFVLFPGSNNRSNTVVGTEPVVSRTFQLNEFNAINVGGSSNVIFRQSDNYSVTIEMPENLFEYVNMDRAVRGSTLHLIPFKPGIGVNFNRHSPRIYIYAPNLESVSFSGAVTGVGWDSIYAENFRLNLSGSTSIDLQVYTDNLQVTSSGASRLTLSGRADTSNIRASGSVRIEAFDLDMRESRITASGSSRVNASVLEHLNASSSGSSRITYRGNPTTNIRSTGSSRVVSD